MIISLAEELDTSVSTLLGETVQEECLDKENMKSISEKLEVINLQLAKRSSMRIHTVRYLLISLCEMCIRDRFILRSKKETYGYSCLTNQKQYYMENYPKIAIEKGTIDEVITMMIRGTEQ